MSVNHKKLVKLAASYSLSCDGWVPVKVADWNFFIDSVNELTEENVNLQAENTRLRRHLNHMVEHDVINDCSIEREVISLLKGDEDE